MPPPSMTRQLVTSISQEDDVTVGPGDEGCQERGVYAATAVREAGVKDAGARCVLCAVCCVSCVLCDV